MIMILNENVNIDNGEESAFLASSVTDTTNFIILVVEEGASRAVEYKSIKYNNQIMKRKQCRKAYMLLPIFLTAVITTNTSKITDEKLLDTSNFNTLHSITKTKTSAVQHVFGASTLASGEPTGLLEKSTMQQRSDKDNVMTSESAQPSSAQGKSAVDSSIVNQNDSTGRGDGAVNAGAGHPIA